MLICFAISQIHKKNLGECHLYKVLLCTAALVNPILLTQLLVTSKLIVYLQWFYSTCNFYFMYKSFPALPILL